MNKLLELIYRLSIIIFRDNDIIIRKIEKSLLKEMISTPINILGIEESILKIINENKSLCRFGDGELLIMLGRNINFQKSTPQLAEKLKEILKENQNFCYVGIPYTLNNFENLTNESKIFWISNMLKYRKKWVQLTNQNTEYLSTQVTRPYIDYEDKTNSKHYFELMKTIWEKKDVIICEGEQTRFGIGNDLLANCNSIKRIICPSENAFEKYFEILNILKKSPKESIILLALGPTATILAYELSKEKYFALDIGHLDIEYEWFLKNANEKIKINNKYVNEVNEGNCIDEIYDEKYLKQIEIIIK